MASADETRRSPEPCEAHDVVLFDGVCNLCNGSVQFIIDHEREPLLRFAALQSTEAERLLTNVVGAEQATRLRNGTDGTGDPGSVILIEGGRGYTHSTAALRVARRLRAPYRWLSWLVIVPRPLRDAIYRFIGRNRYRWFGKSETCRVPTPELRKRFLA